MVLKDREQCDAPETVSREKGGEEMSWRRWLPLSAGFLLAIAGAVNPGPRLQEVRFGYTPSVSIATLPVIAVKRGFDREEGITLRLELYATSPVQAEAIAAGNIDVGGIGDTTLVGLQAAGVRVKFIAQLVDVSRSVELICRSDRGVRSPKDLEGRTLGYTFGGLAHNLVARFFGAYGVDQGRVRQIDLQPAGLVAAYVRGDVDCIALWPPGLIQAKERVASDVLHNGRWSFMVGLKGPRKLMGSHSSVFATERAIREQRSGLVRTLRALRRALDFLKGNWERGAAMVADELKVTRREVLVAFRLLDYKLDLDEEFYRDVYETWLFFHQLGRLRAAPPEGLRGWVEEGLLREVDPRLVRGQ